MKNIIYALFCSLVLAGQVSAGIIASSDTCVTSEVNASGFGDASACLGLFDKDNPGAGPNDSEDFLNNEFLLDDLSSTLIWDASGAFGHNDWTFLGKDEQTSQSFIDATSGDPTTWTVDFALNGDYVIAVKQDTRLGLWYFDNLVNVTAGELFINNIFGSDTPTSDDNWSHISIYSSDSGVVPEPASIALFGFGILGLGLGRRKIKK